VTDTRLLYSLYHVGIRIFTIPDLHFLHFPRFSGTFLPFCSILATVQPQNQAYSHQDTLGPPHPHIDLGNCSRLDTWTPLHSAEIIFKNIEKWKIPALKKMKKGDNSKFSVREVVAYLSNPLGSAWIFHIYIWINNPNHLTNDATCSDLILIFFLQKSPFLSGYERKQTKFWVFWRHFIIR